MTAEAVAMIRRLAHARTEPARLVERARLMWRAHQGQQVPAIARELRLCHATVRAWLQRFNCQGLGGLQERARPGRPATYTPEQVGEVIAIALTPPRELGLPFACWPLDRVREYLSEVKGIGMKRTRIDALLLAEGLRWRQPETWFGERVDPAFAQKRGASRRARRRPLRGVS